MLDLIGAGISLVSGLFGKKSADKEKKAAKRQANNEKAAAKKIGKASVKGIEKQLKILDKTYSKSKTQITKSRDLSRSTVDTQLKGEVNAINLQFLGAQKALELQKQSFGMDREAQGLLISAYKEQETQDRIQIQLETNEIDRQLNENIRAAETERAYKKVAARRSLEKAKEESEDYIRETSAAVASSKAAQAASGFLREGSPMYLDDARATEIIIGTSRILHAGDEEFMATMQEVNELNQFIHTQKESKDINQVVSSINKRGISKRTGLEVKGAKLGLKAVDIQEKAAKDDLAFAEKVKDLSILTATQLAEAQKRGISLSASQEKESLKLSREQQRSSLQTAKSQAKIGAQVSVGAANVAGQRASIAGNAAGMGAIVSGVSGALNTLQSGRTFSSLVGKGNGGFKLFG